MTKRRSQTGLRRAARLSVFASPGLLAGLAGSQVSASTRLARRSGLPPCRRLLGGAARAQSLAGFATAEETHGLVGLSVGAGLVVFAAITALLHLAGRQRWAQARGAVARGYRAACASRPSAPAPFSPPRRNSSWSGAARRASRRSRATSAWCSTRRCRAGCWASAPGCRRTGADAGSQCRAAARARPEFPSGPRQPERPPSRSRGRAIGGRVVMRVRDVSGDRLELVRLREVQARQTGQLDNLARPARPVAPSGLDARRRPAARLGQCGLCPRRGRQDAARTR